MKDEGVLNNDIILIMLVCVHAACVSDEKKMRRSRAEERERT